jgi:hypothetical protein
VHRPGADQLDGSGIKETTMIIDDIAVAIWHKKNKAAMDDRYPKYGVYVDMATYKTMRREADFGRVSSFVDEFIHRNTIDGSRVYKVISENHGWRVFELDETKEGAL